MAHKLLLRITVRQSRGPGRSCCSRKGQGRESNLVALVFREGGGGVGMG